jgi:hypothetical protein
MQHCRSLPIHIVFVLLTEHVSFIPNRILQCCKLIPVKRPSSELYSLVSDGGSPEKHNGHKSHKYFMKRLLPSADSFYGLKSGLYYKKSTIEIPIPKIVPEYLLNMKEAHSIAKLDTPPKDVFNIVCDNIIEKMIQHETLDIIPLRENLYDILLYGLDVTECLWYIIHYFVENQILVNEPGDLSQIMDKMNSFLKFYNNNYRPIYHLESMFIYLITKIYKYPSLSLNESETST